MIRGRFTDFIKDSDPAELGWGWAQCLGLCLHGPGGRWSKTPDGCDGFVTPGKSQPLSGLCSTLRHSGPGPQPAPHLPPDLHFTKFSIPVRSSSSQPKPSPVQLLFHFMEEKTEIPRGSLLCSESHSEPGQECEAVFAGGRGQR